MRSFNRGVYPVMLTPFTEDDQVDYESLGRLVDWYIEKGVDGLFADCQSSEMFFLSLDCLLYTSNGIYFGRFFHYPAYHLVAYGQGRPQKTYDTAFYPV